MKGIILAGGTGSRLAPLTRAVNKSLLPMGRRPIIVHVLDVLVKAGITDVMLITGPEHLGAIVASLGSGKEYDCQMTYRVQEEANGIAAALGMCEAFVGHDKFAVILGDNIFEDLDTVSADIAAFDSSNHTYGLFVKEVPDPQRFGVVSYDRDNFVDDVVEKPINPPSNDAVLGLYLYNFSVFDIIKKLKPSARGEYEISDVNRYVVKNQNGVVHRVAGGWIDAGTHDSYEKACKMIWSKQ